ncbi:MAG: helix-turn-helix domain-containing protein [Mycobacterium sp.]
MAQQVDRDRVDLAGDDPSTRQRILAATAEVLGRTGATKLSFSDVALSAGLSRPTLYRWFASKPELLAAFGVYERQLFERGITRATDGLRGKDRLDAALHFIVDYQQSYSGARLVDVEPALAIAQLAEVIPVLRARLERLVAGPDASVKAATAIRVAVANYIVRNDDPQQFLAQLRHAVGMRQPGSGVGDHLPAEAVDRLE